MAGGPAAAQRHNGAGLVKAPTWAAAAQDCAPSLAWWSTMASIYGRLIVPVTADTRQMSSQVASKATKAGNKAGKRISKD